MGFLNINGNNVHTTSINTTGITNSICSGSGTISSNVTISGGSNITFSNTGTIYSIQPQKTTYHILGEDFEVEGWVDGNVGMIIASINVLGKPYYDELKKQHISLPTEIEEFLKNKFIVLERDRKIDQVIHK